MTPVFTTFYCPLREKQIAFCVKGYERFWEKGQEGIRMKPCEIWTKEKDCTYNNNKEKKNEN